MSEESARVYAAAQDSDRTWDEAWQEIGDINQRADWDIERMLPEVYGDDGDDEQPVTERPE